MDNKLVPNKNLSFTVTHIVFNERRPNEFRVPLDEFVDWYLANRRKPVGEMVIVSNLMVAWTRDHEEGVSYASLHTKWNEEMQAHVPVGLWNSHGGYYYCDAPSAVRYI